jgi:inhibitor of cysteine peptidase
MHRATQLATGLALVMLLTLSVAASATDEKTVTITDKDKDPKVELAKGDKLLVKLAANPTTGFTWVVAKDSDKLKSAGKPEYEAADKGKVGGGGTQTFTFTAQTTGELEVEMQYKRPFEKDKEPAKTFKFKVTIK